MNDSFTPDGLGLLMFLPSVEDVQNPAAAEFADAVDLTYSLKTFTPDVRDLGIFMWDGPRTIERVFGVAVEWVYSRVNPSTVQTVLTPGARGVVAWRLGYAHDVPVQPGQLLNLVLPFRASVPQDSPLGDVGTKTQRLDATGDAGIEVIVL